MKRQNQSVNQNAVRTGATAEQATAQKAQSRKNLYNITNKLIQANTERKSDVMANYLSQKSVLDQAKANLINRDRRKWNNFGTNVATTAANVLDAYSKGVFSK